MPNLELKDFERGNQGISSWKAPLPVTVLMEIIFDKALFRSMAVLLETGYN